MLLKFVNVKIWYYLKKKIIVLLLYDFLLLYVIVFFNSLMREINWCEIYEDY